MTYARKVEDRKGENDVKKELKIRQCDDNGERPRDKR
jgi:hypothetical protein